MLYNTLLRWKDSWSTQTNAGDCKTGHCTDLPPPHFLIVADNKLAQNVCETFNFSELVHHSALKCCYIATAQKTKSNNFLYSELKKILSPPTHSWLSVTYRETWGRANEGFSVSTLDRGHSTICIWYHTVLHSLGRLIWGFRHTFHPSYRNKGILATVKLIWVMFKWYLRTTRIVFKFKIIIGGCHNISY